MRELAVNLDSPGDMDAHVAIAYLPNISHIPNFPVENSARDR
jgi:hypothetical protein